MGTIDIGPFVLASSLLLAGLSYAAASVAGSWAGRRRAVVLDRVLLAMLLVGVVAARFAFVFAYWNAYRGHPMAIVDLRDGGFSAAAGIVAAAAVAGWYAVRVPLGRAPLGIALLAGMLIWLLGNVALVLLRNAPLALPPTELTTLDGEVVQLSSFAGKPLVVNLWATWCPPCRREMPILRDAQALDPDLIFVFADQGESREAVRGYLEREQLALRNVLLDNKAALGRYAGSAGLPTTLFFEANGSLSDMHVGPLSAGSLAPYIDKLRTGFAARP